MRFAARSARKCARAQNFFTNVMFVTKSPCNFFCLIIAQKFIFLEQFEVWWKFLKFRFFWKFWKSSKFLKNRLFIEKNQILVNFRGAYFYEFWCYKYDWGIKKHPLCSKILFWKSTWPRAHFRARCGRYNIPHVARAIFLMYSTRFGARGNILFQNAIFEHTTFFLSQSLSRLYWRDWFFTKKSL